MDIIHRVADRFMDRMIFKSILAVKLATSEIYLHHRALSEEERDSVEKRKTKMLAMGNSLPKVIYESVLTETVYDSLHAEGRHQII